MANSRYRIIRHRSLNIRGLHREVRVVRLRWMFTAGLVLTVLTVLAGASPAPRAQAPATPATTARIKVDLDRTIGDVDPLIFGNFAEHLGRMIYGGIYEEG